MISFRINNEALVNDDSLSVRFELVNPMFEIDKAIASPYSLSFNLPDDEAGVNRRLLKHFNQVNNKDDVYVQDVEVYLFNNFWIKGELAYTYKNRSFECNFVQLFTLANDLENDLNTIQLDTFDYNYGGSNVDFYDDIKERVDLDAYAGTKDYVNYVVFSQNALDNVADIHWNPGNADQSLPDNYCKYLNYWFSQCAAVVGFQEFYIYPYPTNPAIFQYLMSPALYVRNIFYKLFNQYSFNVSSPDFLNLDDIRLLTVFTNKCFIMQVEFTDPNFSVYPFLPSDNIFDLTNFLPDITIKDFLLGIKKTFCLIYEVNFKTNKASIIPIRDIIADIESKDWTQKVLKKYEKDYNSSDGFSLQIDYSDDQDLEDYVHQIKNIPIVAPVSTYANLAAVTATNVGEICLVEDEDIYYIVSMVSGTATWVFFSYNYLQYDVDNGKEEIPIGSDSLLESQFTDLYAAAMSVASPRQWRVPRMNENIDTVFLGVNDKAENLRLLFYRGLQVYPYWEFACAECDPLTYPYATKTEFDPDGVKIGDYSLKLDGENGLYAQWWKPYLDLMARTRLVTYNMKLEVADLLQLDMKKKITIKDPEAGGTVKYYIKKISVRIGTKGIDPAEVELYTA